MTARFLVLYETPPDPTAFDRHYREVHLPLVGKLPGLRRSTLGRESAAVRGGEPPHLVVELEWDTMEDLRAAFASPEGRACAEDAERLRELAPVRSMVFTASVSTESSRAPSVAVREPAQPTE